MQPHPRCPKFPAAPDPPLPQIPRCPHIPCCTGPLPAAGMLLAMAAPHLPPGSGEVLPVPGGPSAGTAGEFPLGCGMVPALRRGEAALGEGWSGALCSTPEQLSVPPPPQTSRVPPVCTCTSCPPLRRGTGAVGLCPEEPRGGDTDGSCRGCRLILAARFAEMKPCPGSLSRVWNHAGKLCSSKDGIIGRTLD